MKFAGKTVLYTGAAGGLGIAGSLEFLKEGATVVAVDNNPAKSAVLMAAASQLGAGRLILEAVDLRDLKALKAGLESTAEKLGGFDIVINNAAIYPAKPFDEFSIDEFAAVQRVNVEAGVVCMQASLPRMKAKQWGRVINISSITFSGGWANLAPYVASKGALVGLTRAWAREFGVHGITVNCISPGAFPTDAEKIHPDPEGYSRQVLERQSLKRRGAPRDIAKVLSFFASEHASFITGQTLSVDGGWWMT